MSIKQGKPHLPGGEKIRFLLAGGFNTALTLAIYWLLLLAGISYFIAYTLSFALGTITSYSFNTCFVFRAPWSWRKLALFPSIQFANYLVGIAVVWVWVSILTLDARLAPVMAAIVVVPASFLMSRLLIKH